MEYLRYRGTYEDLPLEEILQAFQKRYGRERVRARIDFFERSGRLSLREFAKEEI